MPTYSEGAEAADATRGAVAHGPGLLLPSFPFRLLWSPRKPWRVTTDLADSMVSEAFATTMAKEPSIIRRANSYFRHARWDVQRNAISGASFASCRQTGPITVGFGASKRYVDVSGDTVECHLDRPGPDARGDVLVGVGTYTTFVGFYLYPATTYAVEVVKAIRRADPTASVVHPWSPFRIVAMALIALMLIGAIV